MNLRRQKRWLTMALIALWLFLPVSAGPLNYVNEVCIDASSSITPDHVWIPVGCDAPDCCPGCPTSPIDWHIRLNGDAAESVVLRFENLPEGAAGNLVIEGNAHWQDGNSLWVGKGEATLRGFVVDPQAPVPVAVPQFNLNGPGVVDASTAELQVIQRIGQVSVNESGVSYRFQSCSSSAEAETTDRIVLSNNIGMDNAVVLLDGRLSNGCKFEQVFRGSGDVLLGNILQNGAACESAVAVFSDDNAMAWVRNIAQWTDGTGDSLSVTLSPILQIPVTIWLARAGARSRAEIDVINANMRFNSNNAGITFVADYQDISGVSGGPPNSSDCAVFVDLQNNRHYIGGRLNVYYVNTPFTGKTCFKNAAIQIIGTTSLDQTLAHEFGHSFSLGDVGATDFGSNNLMWPQVSNRTDFSVGQAFRMNVNCNSTINQLMQGRQTLKCKPVAMNPACPSPSPSASPCPRFNLDVAPK